MFIPLIKADAAQRIVYGSFDETPDRAGEVCDYATAKPAFEGWSADMQKASGGKSLGNIRAQHDLKKAAGKLIDLTFDDDAKRIDFAAKIVDEAEWLKVEEGVYTGFSPGGSYAKRWRDGAHQRYTPRVGELSIVDVPCNPAATFTMVKADGGEEEIGFVIAKAYEPGNEATKARADELAKAAGKDALAKNYVIQARADLIRENAEAELAKMAEPVEQADALAAALSKADAVLAAAEATEQSDRPAPFQDFAKAAEALRLLKSDAPELQKSLYQIRSLSDLLQQFAWLQSELCFEAKAENDGSAQPAKAAEIVKNMGDLLVTMAQEEVAELIATMPTIEPTVLVDANSDVIVMELATSIVDLVKADAALMEKAGARNSKSDAATIQSMHDDAVKLGATCDAAAEKVAGLEAENTRLTKAVDATVPKVEQLTAALEKTAAELADLKKRAAPAKGAVLEVSKEDDTALAKAAESARIPLGSGDTLVQQARQVRLAR